MTQEFDAHHDSWIEIAQAFDRFGVVVVRRGLDPTVLAILLEEVRAEYARRDAQLLAGLLPPDKQQTHTRFRAIGVGEMTVNGLPAHQLLVTPLVLAVATLVLRKAPGIAFSSFRCARIDQENLVLPYHQDSRIISKMAPQLGPKPPLVNLWVPLQDCGIDCPGLEVVNCATDGLMPVVDSADNFYASLGTEIAPEVVERAFGPRDLWHPPCAAGDLLLFKGTIVHRTHVTPTMTRERISVDIRLM